jgi:hypothetical protein
MNSSHVRQVLVSTIYYLEHLTLQAQSYWIGSFIVTTLQLLLGYGLSLFPKLHSTLLYNPYLTTRTHGILLSSCILSASTTLRVSLPPRSVGSAMS